MNSDELSHIIRGALSSCEEAAMSIREGRLH
jgi:hypothetical protein